MSLTKLLEMIRYIKYGMASVVICDLRDFLAALRVSIKIKPEEGGVL